MEEALEKFKVAGDELAKHIDEHKECSPSKCETYKKLQESFNNTYLKLPC